MPELEHMHEKLSQARLCRVLLADFHLLCIYVMLPSVCVSASVHLYMFLMLDIRFGISADCGFMTFGLWRCARVCFEQKPNDPHRTAPKCISKKPDIQHISYIFVCVFPTVN